MKKRYLPLLLMFVLTSNCITMPDPIWRVSYVADDSVDGIGPSDRNEYALHDTIEVMHPDRMSKEGYVFKEWNTHPSGRGESFKPGSTITIDTPSTSYHNSIRLYAQWEIPLYRVYFDGNGHTSGNVPDPVGFRAGRAGWEIRPGGGLLRSDRIFTGWNTQPDGSGEMLSEISQLPNNDITLYARWVSYDAGSDPANEMAPVPGGRFTMNTVQRRFDPRTGEYELFEVSSDHTIGSFLMARYPVHEKLYISVLTWGLDNGYDLTYRSWREPPSESELVAVHTSWIKAALWCNMYSEMMGYEPVYRDSSNAVLRTTDVGWEEPWDYAHDYRARFDGTDEPAFVLENLHIDRNAGGFRLPREAEWQYAAAYIDGWAWLPAGHVSGDTSGPYETSSKAEEYARSAGYGALPVLGTRKANFLGLYDMSGISQLCEDQWPELHEGSSGWDPMWTVKGFMEIGRRGGGLEAGFRVVRNSP